MPGFGTARQERVPQPEMNEYFLMYDAAVAGAAAVLPNVLIACGDDQAYPDRRLFEALKTACKRMTFVSAHSYGGACGDLARELRGLLSDNNGRVGEITGNGYSTS